MNASDEENAVNLRRGLLRVWIVAAILWIISVSCLALVSVSEATSWRWQYVAEILEDGVSRGRFDLNPYDYVFVAPSKSKFPASFDKVEHNYIDSFEESVTKGELVRIMFPDSTSLYIWARYPKNEQELVSSWFWDARWKRRWSLLREQSWLLPVALIPPLILLMIGFVVRWILKGFQNA
jgi:hypothetical protein